MEPIKEIQEKEENEDPSDGTTKCILNASKICFGDYQVKCDKHLRIELKSKSILIKEIPSYKADNWEGKQLKFKVLIFSKDITEAHYSISDDKIFLFINVSVSFAQDIQEKLQVKGKTFLLVCQGKTKYSDSIIVEAIIIDLLNTQNFMEKWLDKRAIDIPTASVEQFKCNMASLKRRMCKHPLSKSIVREYKPNGNAAVENNGSKNHIIKCTDVLFGTCLMQNSKQILIELQPKALKFCRIPFIKHDPKRISARFNIHIAMKDILEACYSVDDKSGLVFLKIGIVLAESIAKELALKDNLFPKVYCAKNENPRWIVARFEIKEMAVFEEHIKNEEFICFKCITPKETMNLLEANCHNDERLASRSLIRCSGISCNTQEFGTKTSLSARKVLFGIYNCNEKNRKIEIDLYEKYIVFKDIPCKSASKDSSENAQTLEIIIEQKDILEAYFTQLDENNVTFFIRVGFKFARYIEENLSLCKKLLRAESGAINEKTRFIKAYLEDSTAFFQHLQMTNGENDDFIHFEEIQCAKKVKEMIKNDEQQGLIETVSESFIQKCSSTTCIDSSKSLAQLENVSPSSKNIKKNLIVAKEVHFGSYKCPKEGITIEIKPDQMVLQRVTSSQKLDINGKLKEFEIIIDKCDIAEAYYALNNNGEILLLLRLAITFTKEIEGKLQLEKMILQDPSGVEKDRPRFIRIDICDDESKTIEAIQEIFYEKLDYENCSQLLQEDVEFELLVNNTDQDTEVSCISECIMEESSQTVASLNIPLPLKTTYSKQKRSENTTSTIETKDTNLLSKKTTPVDGIEDQSNGNTYDDSSDIVITAKKVFFGPNPNKLMLAVGIKTDKITLYGIPHKHQDTLNGEWKYLLDTTISRKYIEEAFYAPDAEKAILLIKINVNGAQSHENVKILQKLTSCIETKQCATCMSSSILHFIMLEVFGKEFNLLNEYLEKVTPFPMEKLTLDNAKKRFKKDLKLEDKTAIDIDEMVVNDAIKSFQTSSWEDKISDSDNSQNVILSYPSNQTNAIQISKHDLKCLNEDKWLNDNVIDFYLKYMETNLIPDKFRSKIHIFSSLFFQKLKRTFKEHTKEDKDQKEAFNRSVTTFGNLDEGYNFSDISFFIIPIMENSHWFLMILCHPYSKAVKPIQQKERTCILYMDSMASNKKRTIERNYILQFLKFKIKNETGNEVTCDDIYMWHPTVPQQKNSTDCGIYVLQYIEEFVKNPFNVYNACVKKNGKPKWFTRKEIKSKREKIRTLIFDLKKEMETTQQKL